MQRRAALMSVVAVIFETMWQDKEMKAFAELSPEQQAKTWGTNLTLMKPPEEFRVYLGGEFGPKRYTLTDGKDSVTFTPAELMAALKGDA